MKRKRSIVKPPRRSAPRAAKRNGRAPAADLDPTALVDTEQVARLHRRLEDLTSELEESTATLEAIRNGEVDGLLVSGPDGKEQVYSLQGAEQPYRILVEEMQEGAVTLNRESVILYCNRRFAQMLGEGLDELIGTPLAEHVTEIDHVAVRGALERAWSEPQHVEACLRRKDGEGVPATMAMKSMPIASVPVLGVVITDISDQQRRAQEMDRYQTQLRRLTRELIASEDRERRRLSQGLHDNLGQTLAVLKMKVSLLKMDYTPEAVNDLVKHIEEAIRYTRATMAELSNPLLQDIGLVAAIESLAMEFQSRHKVCVDIDASRYESDVDQDIRSLLFQSIRELLYNCVKHAQVDKARVRLIRLPGHVTAEVHDQGSGFKPRQLNPGTAGSSGFGLLSIRERVEHLGGTVEIEAAPRKGTRVTISVPLVAGAGLG